MIKKNILHSKTFWGITFTSIAAIAPIIGEAVDKTVRKEAVNYGEDTAQVLVIICGAATAVVGRIDATSKVYTPGWMPGDNKEDNIK